MAPRTRRAHSLLAEVDVTQVSCSIVYPKIGLLMGRVKRVTHSRGSLNANDAIPDGNRYPGNRI